MSQRYKHSVDSPSSFSSSLLDAVFRSIDEADEPPYSIGRVGGCGGSTMARKSQTKFASISSDRVESYRSIKERKVRSSWGKAETEPATPERTDCGDSASTRSERIEPSRGGAVSTSSSHQAGIKSQWRGKNLKPIRTSTNQLEKTQRYDSSDTRRREGSRCSSKPKPNAPSPTRILENAKSRAAKIYGELKNAKQPISPGGKMMRFISSLFSRRNSTNKFEKVREAESRRTIQAPVITCCSASSYHRSCLSNKSPFSAKTSVRFCPVSIVIGGDEGHCNSKSVRPARICDQEQMLKFRDSDMGVENCRSQVQSDIRELLNKYNKSGVLDIYDKLRAEDGNGVDGGDVDDDGGSCGSSDLFELDHIGGKTNQGIHDELPVYASTQLHNKNSGIWSTLVGASNNSSSSFARRRLYFPAF